MNQYFFNITLGIIDTSYRGVIYMPMRYVGVGNALEEAQKLLGQRIGQLLLKQIVPFECQVVDQLSDTKRGDGGFGSSGD